METATHTGRSPVTQGPPRPPTLGRHDTIMDLLVGTKRGIVPIRRGFVQRGHAGTTKPGPLHKFLTAHDERGLDAYLLVHAMASASEPYINAMEAAVWVRALGIGEHIDGAIDPESDSARSGVSKVMRRLADRNLITRSRRNRTGVITLLREDGTGEPYVRPLGRTRNDRWLRLPHAYWVEGYYRTLSLPAKVVLLIALSLPDGFPLPEDRGPGWYGVSPDTIGTGLRELININLLQRRWEWVRAPRATHGWTQQHQYTLLGSFSTEERNKAARGRDEVIDPDPDTPDLSDVDDLLDVEIVRQGDR